MSSRMTIIGLVLTVSFMASCAGGTGETIPGNSCPVPMNNSAEYLIGPGDTLNIVVWRHEELTTTVPVRPDGKVTTPLVDDMHAAGKTPSQLANDMESVLGEYLRTPEVSVIVTGQGTANQIQVIGEVTTPQSLSYRAGIKVLDVIVSVGGLTEYAAGNRANLVRQTEAGQIKCRLRLKSLLSGDMGENIEVFPGDVIVVPESRF